MLEDPSVFLADEGEDGTLDGAPVRVIFGATYSEAQLGTGQSTAEPRAMLPVADVPDSAYAEEPGVVLELEDSDLLRQRFPSGLPRRYRVREVLPDGTGWAALILAVHEEQPA